jgi:hypothetical protein
MRKILISPGFGAGWSSWSSGPTARYMLTYEPIIRFIEGGGKFEYTGARHAFVNNPDGPGTIHDFSVLHPLLRQLCEECQEKFGDVPFLGGARDLEVVTVGDNERVKVDEYDGSESLSYRDETDWF